MSRILWFEWDRLRSRRDLYLMVVGFSVLILARESSAIQEVGAILNLPQIPPEAAAAQRQVLAAYSIGSSVGTVVDNSAVLVFLVAGFLTCWTLGGEFASGTVRTALLSDPRRGRYLIGRLIGASAVAILCLVAAAAIGASMPTVAAAAGLDVGTSALTVQTAVFLSAAVLVVLLSVSLATLMTVLVRSPALAAFAFLAAVAFGQVLDQPALPDSLRNVLPARAISELLAATAPTGAMLPGGGSFAGETPSSQAAPALVLMVWSIALVLGASALFASKDIRE